MKKHPLTLKLKGKTTVFVDWANVYGWTKRKNYQTDPAKLYPCLSAYPQIQSINFYFGTDTHPKSKEFIKQVRKIGYRVVTKPVKHIVVAKVKGEIVTQRKCDFDIEMVMDIYAYLKESFHSFVFFSGDGDFEPVYQYLIRKGKQVIVIYMYGHLGREIYAMKKGIYKIAIGRFGDVFKK